MTGDTGMGWEEAEGNPEMLLGEEGGLLLPPVGHNLIFFWGGIKHWRHGQ